MLGFSIKLSLKGLVVAAFVLAAAAACLVAFGRSPENAVSVSDEQERLEYICSLGYNPSESGAEAREIFIPREFSAVYEEYNLLQRQAGYDLTPYKGCAVMRYTYSLNDFPAEEYVVINLLVQEGKLIGGDISSRRLDGFMLPLTEKQNG